MAALAPEQDPAAGTGPAGAADFDALYNARYGDVVAMVHALTGDLAEAQDLAQEAFCRAWQRWTAVVGYEDPPPRGGGASARPAGTCGGSGPSTFPR